MLPQQFLAALGIPAFLVVIGMKHRDQIVEFAAAQRVVYEMGARPRPQHDIRPPQIARNIGALEYGAIGDMTRHARLAVADYTLADLRPHAVAADQRPAFNAFATR